MGAGHGEAPTAYTHARSFPHSSQGFQASFGDVEPQAIFSALFYHVPFRVVFGFAETEDLIPIGFAFADD